MFFGLKNTSQVTTNKLCKKPAVIKPLILISLIIVIISLATLSVHAEWIQGEDLSEEAQEADRGTVVLLLGEDTETISFSGGTITTTRQKVRLNVDKGELAGQILEATYARTFGLGDRYMSPALRVGDQVMFVVSQDDQGVEIAEVVDIVRERHLLWLVIAFVAALIALGGWKGFKAVVSLAGTILAILYILIPAILGGMDPIIAVILVSMGVTILTLLLVSGVNKKSLAAFTGTTGGVVAAGIIARFVGVSAKLTGMGDEESQMLMFMSGDVQLDFQGLLFAGIILGALGAAMDVAVSMASSMYELLEHSPDLPPYGLMRAGMNIGRDIMGTMSNTLILAYTGGAMHLLLLLSAFDIPFADIVNRDIIASEVLRAFAGSIGLLVTIPVTALMVVVVYNYQAKFSRPS